jgi:hypothetical protein
MTIARPVRRVSRTYRVREDLDRYVREQAGANGSQAAVVERALERDLRAERRRLAQEAAIMDAESNREFAEATIASVRDFLTE